MIYENALIITCSVSIVANILLIGYLVAWIRTAKRWGREYKRRVLDTPSVFDDPYKDLKQNSGYDWEGSWD